MGATTGRSVGRGFVRLLSVLGLLSAVAVVPMSRADAAPPGDPPGNNGTVKIERDGPADEDRGNEPIGDGCIIWLEFYGFDEGQTADITFTAQAPSGSGELLTDKAVLISDDPAGGGQDRDAVIAYNLTSAVQGLKVDKQQGYHIKLSSDSLEAPGGAKHKVFWIKCAPAQASTLRVAKATQGQAAAGPFAFELNCNHRPLNTTFTLEAGTSKDITAVPAGTICEVKETDTKGAQSTTVEETPSDGAADGKVTLAAGTPGIVTFTNVFPGEGGTPAPPNTDVPAPPPAPAPPEEVTEVAGTTSANPGTPAAPAPGTGTEVLGETLTNTGPGQVAGAALPRTGADPSVLLAAGLWSLTAGGLALTAGGRRSGRG